jgi:hypothetical protein
VGLIKKGDTVDLESARDWVDESEYIDDDGEYKPAFVIDTDEKAAWAMRKYTAALDRVTQAEELADAEMRRIDTWLEERRRVYGRDTEFFGALLSNYALDQRATLDRKKIDLPDGVVQTRSVAEKFVVVDKEAFIEWAKENRPDLLKMTYSPDMKVIADRLLSEVTSVMDETSGEIVPGLSTEPGRVSATIKVN